MVQKGLTLEKWFSTESDFILSSSVPKIFGEFWVCFWLSQWEGCATGIWWVKVRDGAKHAIMHRRAVKTKDYSTQNVSSVDDDKRCIEQTTISV